MDRKDGGRNGSKAKRGESLKKSKTEKRGGKKQKDIELFNNVNSFIGDEEGSREY